MDKQKKKEGIIIVTMLIIALVSAFGMRFFSSGSKVVVSVGGDVFGTYDTYINQEVTIETEKGVNVFTIKDGKAMVTYADCKDQICVNMHALSKEDPGIIVCLPHEVVIEIR